MTEINEVVKGKWRRWRTEAVRTGVTYFDNCHFIFLQAVFHIFVTS